MTLADTARCIYCLRDCAYARLTPEHVIPYALGGPLVLRRAACRKCNSTVVNEIADVYLANSYPPTVMARAELGLKGHSGSAPEMPVKVDDPALGKINAVLRRGESGSIVEVANRVWREGDSIFVTGRSEGEAVARLSRAIGKPVESLDVSGGGVVRASSFSVPQPDHARACRAVAKIAYCYALLELGESILGTKALEAIRRYILTGDTTDVTPEWEIAESPKLIPARHHGLMLASATDLDLRVCMFAVFWCRFTVANSALDHHARLVLVDPIRRKVPEAIVKIRHSWHPRVRKVWAWKRR